MKTLAIICSVASAALFTVSANAAPRDIVGVYKQEPTDSAFVVKEINDTQFSIETSIWQGTAYWDPVSKVYKGIFRYKKGEAGIQEGAAGFHVFTLQPNGILNVSLHWSPADKAHQYSLTKQK